MQRIKIAKCQYIGDQDPCFVVAEMSANHAQDLRAAKKIIKEAKKAGADAIKVQTYTPDTLTIPSNRKCFMVKHPKWGGQTLYELYKKAYMPWEWHMDLKKIADDEGITFFSTPFDKSAVDLLEKLEVPLYKIASFELVDIPLIKYVAQTGKPIIMSTGMATLDEIGEAVEAARENGAKDIILLKCVSGYPADPSEMNLKTIPHLQKTFSALVGISDHSLGIGVAIAAVALGAKVVEKHFILSRKMETPDSFFSIEHNEMKELVENIRLTEQAVGKVFYGLSRKEKQSKVFRKSIFAVKDIRKGEKFTEKNIRVIRPGQGLKPKFLDSVLKKKATRNIGLGSPLAWAMIEKD